MPPNFALPLAELIRPAAMRDYVGQEHLVGHDGAISSYINLGTLPSMILHGPPGVGKTTLVHILATETNHVLVELSATDCTVAEMRLLLLAIRQENAKRTRLGLLPLLVVVFIDEIHRFSSTQQDFLLPFVELGDFVFIGATTVTPHKRVRKAILSRCQLHSLKALTTTQVVRVLRRASLFENIRRRSARGLRFILYDAASLDLAAKYAAGDTRTAIGLIELVSSRLAGPEWTLATGLDPIAVSQLTVEQTIKDLTKTRLGLQHQANLPLVTYLFDCMNGVAVEQTVEPEPPRHVSFSHTEGSLIVRVNLDTARDVASDLESEVDDVELNDFCKRQSRQHFSVLHDIDHMFFSDDSDTELGISDAQKPKCFTNRISRSKHQGLMSVHALLQLLHRGEAPLFLLKQLILYACIYLDSDSQELPRVVSAKKGLEHATMNDEIVLSNCVLRLTQCPKLQGNNIVKQIKSLKEYFELSSGSKKGAQDYLHCTVTYDETLFTQLLTEPAAPMLAAASLPNFHMRDEMEDGYTLGAGAQEYE